VTTSVHGNSGVASHSKNIVLSNNTGVSHSAEVTENDTTSEGEAAANHDHQYQVTFQEDDKPEYAAVPQA
jgi:hypothetical protein